MTAETLDQAAREGTLGVRPEVGLRSETGNNGESLRKKGGYPVHCAYLTDRVRASLLS